MRLQSKVYIRHALAVFAHEDNLPCVVHCTHGELCTLNTQTCTCTHFADAKRAVVHMYDLLHSLMCAVQHCSTYIWPWLVVLCVCPNSEGVSCAASGKDRTGLMSALLLLMCGVGRDAVVEDYVQSEANLKVCTLRLCASSRFWEQTPSETVERMRLSITALKVCITKSIARSGRSCQQPSVICAVVRVDGRWS